MSQASSRLSSRKNSVLQVTLAAWQEFDSQQEAVQEFVNKARSTMERDLNFSSPESLAVEVDQARVSPFCKPQHSCFLLLEVRQLNAGRHRHSSLWNQVLLKQCEAEVSHMNTLLKRATEIQLGPKNKTLLLQQARSLSEQVDNVEAGLKKE